MTPVEVRRGTSPVIPGFPHPGTTAPAAIRERLNGNGRLRAGTDEHAGMVICGDGTPEAATRPGRMLWNDPACGVMRHADAGYPPALDCARQQSLDLPAIFHGHQKAVRIKRSGRRFPIRRWPLHRRSASGGPPVRGSAPGCGLAASR